jgi:acetylornithine/N-succinyldiaminopimelate aminotransferase
VDGGDIDALRKAADEETAGILMEPIQGEGGINVYPAQYPAQVRQLCDDRGITMIADEVWTGCGRTGRWFAHQHFQRDGGGTVEPDIMTLGKAVGGGLPVGVMYARSELAALLVPSTHGCTLGGNPICMAVARTIFDVIERDRLVEHAAALGARAVERLKTGGKIAEVRGRGAMLGIELAAAPEKFVEKLLAKGVCVNVTAQKVIRLAPPINIDLKDWDMGLDLVAQTIAAL